MFIINFEYGVINTGNKTEWERFQSYYNPFRFLIHICHILTITHFRLLLTRVELTHRVNGVTYPLQNATKKRMVFSNTILCSKKDLGSSFSKNVWPFE